ncbi:EpsG family protein [Ruminococcus sp. OM05-10BH]|nr:EpsG family protein [Ruminococcus sp. OM05-10BH]
MRIYVYQLILLILSTVYYYFRITYIRKNENRVKKLKIGFLVINMGTLIFISGFRGASVGTDTRTYLSLYNISKSLTWSELFDQRVEWAYGIVAKLCSLVYDNHQFYIFIFSLIIGVGFAVIIYKSSDDVPLSVFLYVTLRIYSQSMNIMRQSVAIMLVGIAYLFIKEKKWLKATILIILATGFHTTAIVGLSIPGDSEPPFR